MPQQSKLPVRPRQSDCGDPRQQLEVDFLRQPPERAVAHRRRRLEEGQRLQMVRDDAEHLAADVVAAERMHVEPIEQPRGRRDARLFVIHRSDPPVDERGRRRLAEIVADGAEHHRDLLRVIEIVDARARLVDDHQRVHPDVALGMPLRLLRAADERLQLGEELR